MKNKNYLLAAAFLGFAALGLARGYFVQSQSATPPRATAYSYTNVNNGKAEGKVGDAKDGLEYVIEDFNAPRVKVSAAVNGVSADVSFDKKKKDLSYDVKADLDPRTTFNAVYSDSGSERVNRFRVNRTPSNSWFSGVGFNVENKYDKASGKTSETYTAATRFNGFNKPLDLFLDYQPGYGLRFNFKFV